MIDSNRNAIAAVDGIEVLAYRCRGPVDPNVYSRRSVVASGCGATFEVVARIARRHGKAMGYVACARDLQIRQALTRAWHRSRSSETHAEATYHERHAIHRRQPGVRMSVVGRVVLAKRW
jgi:hypothetical protein